MNNPWVLLVEDDPDIQNLLSLTLKGLGLEVALASDGDRALELIQSQKQHFDLYILDWMLPGVSGIEICRFIRLYGPSKHTPILMLTALTDPERVIEGLDAGADDYLTKPYDTPILEARVRALIRRSMAISLQERPGSEVAKASPSHELRLGELLLDLKGMKAYTHGAEIALTLSEFRLLQALLENPGKVLTRQQLMNTLQGGEEVHVTPRTIDTHVFGLRKKIGDFSKSIETIRGIGYRVIPE